MLLAVRISSYECTWEVLRALKKLELLSAAPRATLTHFWCSPNFPRASTLSMNEFLNFDCLFDLCARSCKESGSRTATVPSISNNQPLAIRSEVKISAQEG